MGNFYFFRRAHQRTKYNKTTLAYKYHPERENRLILRFVGDLYLLRGGHCKAGFNLLIGRRLAEATASVYRRSTGVPCGKCIWPLATNAENGPERKILVHFVNFLWPHLVQFSRNAKRQNAFVSSVCRGLFVWGQNASYSSITIVAHFVWENLATLVFSCAISVVMRGSFVVTSLSGDKKRSLEQWKAHSLSVLSREFCILNAWVSLRISVKACGSMWCDVRTIHMVKIPRLTSGRKEEYEIFSFPTAYRYLSWTGWKIITSLRWSLRPCEDLHVIYWYLIRPQ